MSTTEISNSSSLSIVMCLWQNKNKRITNKKIVNIFIIVSLTSELQASLLSELKKYFLVGTSGMLWTGQWMSE